MKTYFLTFLICLGSLTLFSQNEIKENKYKFVAYDKVPAWVGVIDQFKTADPKVYIYDFNKYQGHSNFYAYGLKKNITFKQFRDMVSDPVKRDCLPFFLYDMRSNPFFIANESYRWAIRLEDYAYTDNHEQMLVTVAKVVAAVEKRITAETGVKEKVCIVLYSGTGQKPNMELAEDMNMKNLGNVSFSGFLKHFGAAKVQVLNAGTAYGHLRYVHADSTELVRLHPTDIVIYERAPIKVPLVAGFITLQPQTPLSHVNLLAINRKTPNIYLSTLDDLPGAQSLIGKPVKFQCNNKKVFIIESSESEILKDKSRLVIKLQVPAPDTSITGIVSLDDARLKNKVLTGIIGAKASNYKLLQENFPEYVGPGDAICLSEYFRLIHSCRADKLIASLNSVSSNDSKIDALLEDIRNSILSARIDSSLIAQLTKLMNEKFSGHKIRIRSSTNCEDLPRFNGAGLYISNGIKPGDKTSVIKNKLLEVYASLWSRNAYDERNFFGIDQAKVGMGILINEAFEDEEANGVILTIPDQTVSVLIDSQKGDHLVTNPGSGDVPEELLFPKSDDGYQIRSRSNIGDVFIGNEELEKKLPELHKLALQIHQLMIAKVSTEKEKYGTDIEFKIVRDQNGAHLRIKQARLLYAPLPQ